MNHSSPSLTKIRNARSRLVEPSKAAFPWHPHIELRNAVIAMRKLERKFERLHTEAEKRIDKWLATRNFHPRMKERKREVMLEKAKYIAQDRLIRKAEKLQKVIDKMNKQTGQSFNQLRRAA